jgi:Xaa-Pro aminopeptidase
LPRYFPAAEFTGRRARVVEAIGPRAVAVLQGAPLPGGFDVFRQTNEFYYLSGIEVPHAYLLIEGRSGRSTLFLPDFDAKLERSEGPVLNSGDAEAAIEASGVDDVRRLADLVGSLAGAPVLYSPHSPGEGSKECRDRLAGRQRLIDSDPWDGAPSRERRFLEKLAAAVPGAEIRDLTPVLDELRGVKSPVEVEVMRQAGRLTARAIAEAMRATRPGVMEYELGALAERIFLAGGARGGGYRPIIAGGPNAWYAHYFENRCTLCDGDLVLMDYAPDFRYYTSDIGRMWPVGGTYLPWQRELYGFMVEYHKTLLRTIRPGVTASQILREAAADMERVIAATRFSKPHYAEAARRTLEFAGHLSHPVGMAVHDPCDYTPRPLAPGVVFALDPQMWVPEEQLYIRVEDTVAVTESGVEVLTPGAPLELDEVEKTVGAAFGVRCGHHA